MNTALTAGADAFGARESLAASGHPMIRLGSQGESVGECQSKLNRVDARLVGDAGSGLDNCPLRVDAIFGPRTRAAVVSFQKFAFPFQPSEWDGVVGPHTWGALDVHAATKPKGQIAPSALTPSRWGPLLAAAASSGVALRDGNAVRTLIDGRETFEEMVSDIRLAQGEGDYIYLLGWDISDDFNMIPGDAATTVRALLSAASARNVQIRVILWAKPPGANFLTVRFVNTLPNGAAIRDDLTANNHPMSEIDLVKEMVTGGVDGAAAAVLAAIAARDPVALTGAHHQKVLVIKRGETLLAYCGGLDINRNRLEPVSPSTGDPQHDVHCRIVGPAAWDLLQTFIMRWRHHPDGAKLDAGAKGPLRGVGERLPAPIPTPPAVADKDAPFGGVTSVMIGRTFNPVRSFPGAPPVLKERDIQKLVLAGIRNAQRFLYIEDQYLIDLDVADTINRVLPQIAHVTVLIPGNAITEPTFMTEYRRDFMERALRGLVQADAAKLRVFQLSRSQTVPTFGPHCYVHAKTWVIDDELAIIGSANCNRRGYQHDSEVDAFMFGTTAGRGAVNSLAQAYRIRLWREHLGLPATALVDGVKNADNWLKGIRPATARVIEFDHRLPATKWQAVRDKAAEALRKFIDPVP
ncbi:phospholipase D-like domain-containing protein [Sphingomonas sp. TREG-RG-20F-R18-01]|uniref:phospholipase D-like domain-containing protein n=1 Tax=Sphingomonas sp. TREG-RG-20F-R18-01 TaxID=2914982 RepID=UPI001F5824B5|nr:phospholipase D-like domain-containing protein [Sphingomonas sp. TREG-RG-20F-R18-01]